MISANPENLSRPEIKAVFKRHDGAASQLAKDLGVNRSRISDWFARRYTKPNAMIEAAVRQRAADLINAERKAAKTRKGSGS